MSIIKKNTREFFSLKIWLVMIVFSWQAASCLQMGKDTLSYWEFILAMMTDHYYIFYFMVPFLVISLYRQLDTWSDFILIRSKKFFYYFFSQAVSVLVITVIYVMLHLLIVAVIGVQLKSFANVFELRNNWHEQLQALSNYFETPGSAIIASVIYMILGLTFINILIVFLNYFFGKRIALISQVMGYVLMIVGLHSDLDEKFPWIIMNYYIVLHHGLSRSIIYLFSYIIVEIIVLVMIFVLFDRCWWKTFGYKKKLLSKGIKQWYWKMLFRRKELSIILGILGISVLSKIIFRKELTLPDLLLFQFWGHGIGYFSITEFMDMIVLNGLPIYFLCVFYQDSKTNSSLAVMIRLKNKRIWLNQILQTGLFFCIVYVLLAVGLTLSLGYIFGLEPQGYHYMKDFFVMENYIEPEVFSALFKFIVAKIMELILLFVVIIVLDSWICSTTISFLILLCVHGACIFSFKYLGFMPIGISFFSRQYTRINGNKVAYGIIFSILLWSIVIGYLLLRYWRTEKLLEDS